MPVGVEIPVMSCNLHILVDETAESISAQRRIGALDGGRVAAVGGC
jgi:hypothetical protein